MIVIRQKIFNNSDFDEIARDFGYDKALKYQKESMSVSKEISKTRKEIKDQFKSQSKAMMEAARLAGDKNIGRNGVKSLNKSRNEENGKLMKRMKTKLQKIKNNIIGKK